MLTHILDAEFVVEVELTKIAYSPWGPGDSKKFTGKNFAKVLKVFRGDEKVGNEIEFTASLTLWKSHDKLIVFLDKNRHNRLALPRSSSVYSDFVSTFGELEGPLDSFNKKVKEKIRATRSEIQNECKAAKSKRETKLCKMRLARW